MDNANNLSSSIQTYLEQSLKQLEEMNKIYTNLQDTVKSHLLGSVRSRARVVPLNGQMVIDLNEILLELDRIVQNSLQSHMDKLPTLNLADIDHYICRMKRLPK